MVCFAVIVFDFGTGSLILVVSLVAAPRTLHNCFTASVHCVPIFKTLLVAYCSFLIFVNFNSLPQLNLLNLYALGLSNNNTCEGRGSAKV